MLGFLCLMIADQISPQSSPSFPTGGAYSGMFLLPTTAVTPEGEIAFSFANGELVQETIHGYRRLDPRGSSYNATLGFLPGLELGVSFNTPSLFNGIIDDRAVAAKYRLLSEPNAPISLAIGSTDVQGTRLRATDYAVAGKHFGNLDIYAGYARGLRAGEMGGGSLNIARNLQIAAERDGNESLIGLRSQLGRRVAISGALDENKRPFAGISYAVPIASPSRSEATDGEKGDGTDALVRRIVPLCGGTAEVHEYNKRLIVRYEDVQARDPVRTFAMVLRLCLRYATDSTNQLTVTVSRFGRDMVTLSGPIRDIYAYVHGWSTIDRFFKSVSLIDGSPNDGESEQGPSSEAGENPGVQITLAPSIGYRLGIQNELPNQEWITAKAVAPLPLDLIAVASKDIDINNNLQSASRGAGSNVGLYRTDLLDRQTRTMVGIDKYGLGPWAATAEFAHYWRSLPISATGYVSQPITNTLGERQLRYGLQGGVDAMHGSLEIFARQEVFSGGDAGATIGATRRFGQTYVSITTLNTKEGPVNLRKAGITFQIPLPEATERLGPVQIASANTFDFGYTPTIHATFADGMGVPRALLLTPDNDLTARSQLTAWFFRQQANKFVVK